MKEDPIETSDIFLILRWIINKRWSWSICVTELTQSRLAFTKSFDWSLYNHCTGTESGMQMCGGIFKQSKKKAAMTVG